MIGVSLVCLVLLSQPAEPPVDFDTEVIPVLTKAGCNGGACHGAAAGRGGFHLSLLGSDPATDYDAITQALEGRRVNLAHPELSLVLTKPTGKLHHGGGAVLSESSASAGRLKRWIASGAERGPGRRLARLDVSPRRVLRTELPATITLRVMATFDDHPPVDVTAWTVFTPADSSAVGMVSDDVARINRRGQSVIIARFLDRVVPIELAVPYSDAPVDLSHEPRGNFIDDEVLRVLSDLRLPVSPPASDADWLRRVSLDLVGRLPELEVTTQFLEDASPQKREQFVDSLLASDAFADYWTLRIARLLRLHSLPNEPEAARAYADWLHREIQLGTPFDNLARKLLTATGDSHTVGPANFPRMVADARGQAELVGQVFLGVRLGCANCHNHPLDRWTQEDYHGLAAVFARLDRGRVVTATSRGAVTNLRTNEPAVPRIPGEQFLTEEGDHRAQFADWLTATGNRYFAKATVNRLWKGMFGRGLVDPTDDLRETNPPTHPELLERLADDFVEHRFNLRRTLRLIALSHTYARGSSIVTGNELDDRFYSRSYPRPLDAEVLADAIADVTGVREEYAGQPVGTRAVTLYDPLIPAPSLDILGRCQRAGRCEESDLAAHGLTTELHLLNGELINAKIADPKGRLHQRIAGGDSNESIVTEFHRHAFGRAPSPEKLRRWIERLATDDARERRDRLEDFVWALVSSREFRHNGGDTQSEPRSSERGSR